jgi:hypothetical protein
MRIQNDGANNTSYNQPKGYGIARSMAEGRRIYNMRFSKKSVSPGFTCGEVTEETGAFLALCRVYVVKLLNVDDPITNSVIKEAMENNYDAIFSTKTGEYSLLNPHHVLPEFIIQCAITTNDNNTERINEDAVTPLGTPKSNFRTLFLHSKALSHLTCRSVAHYLSSLESNVTRKNGGKGKSHGGNTEIMMDDDVLDISDRSSRIRSEQKIEIASIIAEATNEFFDKKGKLVKDLVHEHFPLCKKKIDRAIKKLNANANTNTPGYRNNTLCHN